MARQRWLMFSKLWLCYNEAQEDSDKTNTIQMNKVFANCSEEDAIYPLTFKEIIEAQKADNKLKPFFRHNATLDKGLELRIIKDQKCICNKGRLVYPSRCNVKQQFGTTNIFSTRGTAASKGR
jgi:hypothetical protein